MASIADSTMSSEATELRPSNSQLQNLFQKFHQESKAVTISMVALVAACLAALLALLAYDDATTAKVTTEVELRAAREEIETLREDIAVRQIRTSKLEAWLKAHGVPVEEIQE